MDTVLNLGNPSKDLSSVFQLAAPKTYEKHLKTTGARVVIATDIQITTAVYGAGMTLDCLEEMYRDGLLTVNDRLVMVGSMGSLNKAIALGDVVIPNPCQCAYYDFDGRELAPDANLLFALELELKADNVTSATYKHGSSFAVYDHHTNHANYTTSLYDHSVKGVDCGEVYIGLEFAHRRTLRAAAVLYCSDSPERPISAIGTSEFDTRAAEFDLKLNRAALRAIRRSRQA